MNSKSKILNETKRLGIEGILLTSPENIYYLTGLAPHQLTVSRKFGFSFALISSNPKENTLLTTMDYEYPALEEISKGVEVLPYDTWVGVKSLKEWRNKSDEDSKVYGSSMDVLKKMMDRFNLQEARVGIELDFLAVNDFTRLKENFPKIEWINVSEQLIKSRSVKTLREIEVYRKLTEVCDKALLEMSKYIKLGISEDELIQIYRRECMVDNIYPSSWSMLGAGPNASMLKLPSKNTIKDGNVLRFDGGCEASFEFYKTDFARSWIVGDADPELIKIKQILYSAQRKMIESIKPGLEFKELFKIGFDLVKEKLPNYKRGHLGHSISLGPQTADAPFISLDQEGIIEENMILCVEVPLYIRAYNGFNIEDMILVKTDGAEILTYRTPHFLEEENS